MLLWWHMIKRNFWINQINNLWEERSLIWLTGVRRVGKTYLCQSLEEVEYFDCELPGTRKLMSDPETFLEKLQNKNIILDEVHRLENPSELLKIATDHFSNIKIIATGSSTITASKKFKDTLTGRKIQLWLTPMVTNDLLDFKNRNSEHRLLMGGLPPFFISKEIPERYFQEWMDDYWAKDIQELFRLERKDSFQKFFDLILNQSGGIFEASKFAQPCEVSRHTISNYLRILESTFVFHIIKPFSTYKPTEIVSAPKIYAFDTGFVCYYKGWEKLRNEDLGYLWEHFVLNEIQANLQSRQINYWRDKRGHEVDFILKKRGKQPIAIECKWKSDHFNPSGLEAFRRQYPDGDNYLVASDISINLSRKFKDLKVQFVNLSSLIRKLT